MNNMTPDSPQNQITKEPAEAYDANSAYAHADFVSPSWSKTLPLSLFVKAVEQAPVAISITDKKANILYINKAFSEVTGYSDEEILGENESKLSDKSTLREVYHDLWRTIARKQTWRGRLVNRHKNGQSYLADLTIAPMLDEQGAISHYIGMHRDITRAHRDEQQVGNQKKLIESVINASPVAMVVLDSERRIVLDNHRYKMLVSELGLNEPALYFLEVLQQEIEHFWTPTKESAQGFNNREICFTGSGRRSTRWFSCYGNWFCENDNTGAENCFSKQSKDFLLLCINDITLQRRQQEKLKMQSLQTLLAEDEHLRSIRETLLGAMHQIRQPLNQINAAIQIMGQRNDHQNQPLKDLLYQVQSMGEETIRTLQRCVPEIPESAVIPVNLNQLLHEVILLYSHKFLANGVVLDWLPERELPSILGSENKLRMLFKQLLDNSVNAMNRASSRERLIKITTLVAHNWVYVTISDTGPGIPAGQRNKVFEPFFTTGTIGGVQSGMGLVMAKEVVNQHNGMIEIDPDTASGCCFTISFPRCPKNISTVTGYE